MEICIKWTVCRVCLEEESNAVQMVSIFDQPKLSSQISECSGVEVKPSDSLPEKICKKCIFALKYAIKFRTTCRKSTEYLQSILTKAQSASTSFKPANSVNENTPFETIDFLEEEHSTETENTVEHGELQYVFEDMDVIPEDDTKHSEHDEPESNENQDQERDQDNLELIYMLESDVKQEIYVDEADEEEAKSETDKREQSDEFMPNEETRSSDDEQKLNLRRYDIKPKPNQPFEYICDICGNHFTKRGLLNFHMKIHRNEKNHKCEICSKSFNSPCNLRAHIRVHTGEKPFECQFCKRKFADRSTQIKHERIHTNEKPYTCGECGKAFSLSTSLKAHEKMHSGERPYRCETCSKSFTLPHQLKAHLLTNMHRILTETES